MKRRRFLLVSFVPLTMIAALFLLGPCSSGHTAPQISPSGHDEITQLPMFNKQVLEADSYRLQIWTESAAIMSSTTVHIIFDVVSNTGAQPVRRIDFAAADSFGRTWKSEIELAMIDPSMNDVRDGQILMRYRLLNPFGVGFSSEVCSRPRTMNVVNIDVFVRTIGSDEAISLGRLKLRAISR